MLKRTLLTVLITFSVFYLLHGQTNQNDSCQTAIPFCGSGPYTFPGGVNSGNAQPGPNYGCLGSEPNPAWYYMQIGASGNIVITMQSLPALDIDFICWGPFNTPTGACQGGLTGGVIVDCSYSPAAVEQCDIPGALTGQFYILLITNFSNSPCQITFSQTNYGAPGSGTTNCNIVILCSLVALGPTPTACNGSTNTYGVSGNIEFSNPPATGTLTITDQTAVPPVSQTFSAPFISPQFYNLQNIPCDGLQHNLTASFSDSTTCSRTEKYNAPMAILPTAHMYGGGAICAYPTAVSNILIDLTGAPPFTFTYAINGVPQPPVLNYSGPYPYVISTNSPATYTMLSVSNTAGAGTVSGSATVVVNPLPVVTLNPFPPACLNTPPFPLSGGSPAGGIYIGKGITAGIFDPSKAGPGNDTIIYRYTDLNGCTSTDTAILTVNLNPLLTVTNTDPVICSGQSTNIQLSANLPGSTFSWVASSASPGTGGFASGAGNSITQVLSNSSFVPGTVRYIITAQSINCFSQPDTIYVTVKPLPDLSNSPPSHGICNGQTATVNLTSNVPGTTFTWTCTQTSGNITGWAGNPGPPSTLISQVLNLTVPVQDSVVYHLTPQGNGCTGPVYDYTVRVNPVPSLTTQPMRDTICSGTATNIFLTATCAGTTFTWTAAQGLGNATGYANGAGNNIVQTLTNNISTLSSVQYTIIPSTSTCAGNDTVFEEFVRPVPHLANAPASHSQCNNTSTNVILTSDVAGAQFTWTCTPSSANVTGWANNAVPAGTLNQTLNNSGNITEWVTYHITPTAGGCNGPVTDYIVTVFPTATLTNLPAAQPQCDNLNTNIALTSNVAGTLFTWTCTPSSGNITGWANNAVPAGTISQILDNTGYNTEWVTYQVTPTANGCTGTPGNYTVTVYPTPDLSNSPASKSQCDNLPTNISLISNVTGTLFTWTCTPSSANITGWTNNAVPATVLNQVLDNTGFNAELVTYHLTPAANGCNGNLTDYAVTVFPTPNLSNAPPSMQICNNTSTNLTLTSNVTGSLFTWTCTPSSANVTGFSNNAVPTTLLNQLLTNLGLNTEWVTYHVTPAANGCTGPLTDYTVTVVQSPDVFFNPPAQTICSQQTSGINVLSSVPGTTFTWTATPSSPNLSGQAAGSGNAIAQTVTNSGNTIEWVTYQVTPTAFGCPPGNSQNVVLTVDPRPLVNNAITNFQICSASATNINPTATVPGSTYAWTASGSSPNVTGFSNGAGPAIVQTLTNSGFNLETVTYQVTATANGCPGNATPFVVTVFPVPNVIFTPNGQSLCSGSTTSVNLTSGAAGTTFTWTASGSGPSLSGYAPGSGNIIQQLLNNSGPYPETATYQVAPTANGCPGIANSVIVTVNPLPVVTLTPCFDPVVSVLSQPFPLKGNIPPGGTWSGTGVNAGSFFPGFAGAGVHVINYSYTNTWGCIAGVNIPVTVVALAPFACGTTLVDVRDNLSYSTVQIGGQCWFAVNLDYGSTIASAQMQVDNCISEKYCFGDNPANCASTGGLYQWDELMKYGTNSGAQGFCPPEWHIPTEADWNTLFNVYISNGFAGSPLKFTGFSGFNALLSGTRFNDVQWDFSNFAVMFWSSNAHSARKAWAHGMNSFNPSVSFYPSHRNNAFFVRCIKD
jgi:uncharacterized protein (TIGR02145 family)